MTPLSDTDSRHVRSSWGPLGWVVAAEQFPLSIAPLCVSLATASNWVRPRTRFPDLRQGVASSHARTDMMPIATCRLPIVLVPP